ncbi:MAG: toxin-activating lysine-acyltransferase [Pseudomonadota bacterium]
MSIETAPAADDEEVAVRSDRLTMVGEIIRLMSMSPRHRTYTLEEIERRFLMPAGMDQIRIYRTAVEPIAAISWALVSDEVHAKLLENDVELDEEDLRAGDNLWIVDAALRPQFAEMVRDDITTQVFPNFICHMRVPDPESGEMRIEKFYGANRQGDAKAAGAA